MIAVHILLWFIIIVVIIVVIAVVIGAVIICNDTVKYNGLVDLIRQKEEENVSTTRK